MKKLSILPFLALLIAVAASAFTVADSPNPESSASLLVWQYQPVNSNGPSDPLNYVKLADADEEFECGGSSIVCQIMADEDPNTHKPVIDPGDDPSVQTTEYQTSFRDE